MIVLFSRFQQLKSFVNITLTATFGNILRKIKYDQSTQTDKNNGRGSKTKLGEHFEEVNQLKYLSGCIFGNKKSEKEN